MDDPDQTAPVPQDDGQMPPPKPTPRETDEMKTGNRRADPHAPSGPGRSDR